jgi:ribonuclease P protein component
LAGPGDRRFPKRCRLLKPAEFKAVFDHRCISGGPLFTNYAAPNDTDEARLGLVVSRKVSLLAVDRNRVKRLVRECFRAERKLLAGLDVVVVARRPATGASSGDLRAALYDNWKALSRKCKKS